jgi:hypothetical protein
MLPSQRLFYPPLNRAHGKANSSTGGQGGLAGPIMSLQWERRHKTTCTMSLIASNDRIHWTKTLFAPQTHIKPPRHAYKLSRPGPGQTCPHQLWATLWIKMCISAQSRSSIGLAGGAQKTTRCQARQSQWSWCRYLACLGKRHATMKATTIMAVTYQ